MKDIELEKERATLSASEKYLPIFSRVTCKLRELGVRAEMPGYTMIIQSCAIKLILEYENMEDIYDLLEKITVIPSIPVIKVDIRPAEQWMKEALRAAGILYEVEDFIERMCKKVVEEEIHG